MCTLLIMLNLAALCRSNDFEAGTTRNGGNWKFFLFHLTSDRSGRFCTMPTQGAQPFVQKRHPPAVIPPDCPCPADFHALASGCKSPCGCFAGSFSGFPQSCGEFLWLWRSCVCRTGSEFPSASQAAAAFSGCSALSSRLCLPVLPCGFTSSSSVSI